MTTSKTYENTVVAGSTTNLDPVTGPEGDDVDMHSRIGETESEGTNVSSVPSTKQTRKRKFIITGEIVPRGALKPNANHPFAELPEGKTRREAFIDALGDALAELPKRRGGPLDS